MYQFNAESYSTVQKESSHHGQQRLSSPTLASYDSSLYPSVSSLYSYQQSFDSYSMPQYSYYYNNYISRASSPAATSYDLSLTYYSGLQQPSTPTNSSYASTSSYSFNDNSAHDSSSAYSYDHSSYANSFLGNTSTSPLTMNYPSYSYASYQYSNEVANQTSVNKPCTPSTDLDGFNKVYSEACVQQNLPVSSSPQSNLPSRISDKDEGLTIPEVKTKTSSKASIGRRPPPLSETAVSILNEWFDEHINSPYPQQHEKELLAERCQLTVKQVSAWFSNRRNRLQITKPKRMQRMLVSELSTLIDQTEQQNVNKHEIIEQICHKLKSTFK